MEYLTYVSGNMEYLLFDMFELEDSLRHEVRTARKQQKQLLKVGNVLFKNDKLIYSI